MSYKIKNYILPLITLCLLSGCASINSLPQSAQEVDFNRTDEGKTGWAEWQDTMHVKGVDKRTAYQAAKSGLADAGFTLKRASFDEGFAIGEHGMTAYDWNIVAGIYIKEIETGYMFKAIVEGSKDFGFWGDMTQTSWVEKIFKGIREYILTESMISNPDRNIFN